MKSPSSKPIFILGSPRSGTSLLRLMLTSHPDIVIPPESGFAVWLMTKYGNSDWSKLDSRLLEEFLKDLQCCRKFETWELSSDEIISQMETNSPSTYADVITNIYLAFARKQGKPWSRWGDKNNFHVDHVSDIFSLYPGCHFIHLVRDVRDVACSYQALQKLVSSSPYVPRLPNTAADIVSQWISNVTSVKEGLAKVPQAQQTTIRYEDLVASPETQLRRLCVDISAPYSASMLEFYRLNRQQQLEPEATRDWKLKTFEPVSTGSVGVYRNNLSSNDCKAITDKSAPFLSCFGYDID